MRTLKDKRKFGWNKPIKNRSCRSFGYSYGDKESRRRERRYLGEIKDLIIHRQPINIEKNNTSIINKALEELGYDLHIYWAFFEQKYLCFHTTQYNGERKEITKNNFYDFL